MKRKCYTEAGTALTKAQTGNVLALGYDHLIYKGSTTYLSGLRESWCPTIPHLSTHN